MLTRLVWVSYVGKGLLAGLPWYAIRNSHFLIATRLIALHNNYQSMGQKHSSLHAAKNEKKDEFYTQMDDVTAELKYYRPHFKDKVVFCNCDDPYESNFFKYFALNFNALGLRKLIATCYDGSPVSGNELLLDFGTTTDDPKKIAYKVEITEVPDSNGDGAINLADVRYLMENDKNVISTLHGNGDFRSPECVELLKQADVVVTNPPFSLFREYVAQLMEYNKKFLIIGNMNAITYKEIFSLIKQNKIWMGLTMNGTGQHWFKVPDDYNKGKIEIRNGVRMATIGSACWFTNIDNSRRHEELDLYKHYTPEEFPKYDNYDAINVNRVSDIPCDYDGVMGVPITFLDKYNPDQFEIIKFRKGDDDKDLVINGKSPYFRILIRKKK